MSSFSFPINKKVETKLDYYAFGYCYPYFYQDWRLFTPCPKSNFTICASYKINNQTHYALPLQEVLHEKNLFTGREFLMLSMTSASGYVADDAKDSSKSVSPFVMNKNYVIFRTVFSNYLKQKHHQEISDLKLILLLTDIKTKQKKYLIDP